MNHKNLKDYIENNDCSDKLPFISTITLNNDTQLKGIIINKDKHFLSFYNILLILDEPTLYHFTETCLDWWWYSNQKIPINLFYPDKMSYYTSIIEHYPMKGVKDISGHIASLTKVVEGSRPYKKTTPVDREK